jgi:D-aminopeptidase
MSHGSGDYVLAFSSAPEVRIRTNAERIEQVPRYNENHMSSLFQAAVEATEEAIYNSLLKATTVKGIEGRESEALPIDKVKELMKKYGKMK